MILGDGHINGVRVSCQNLSQIIAAVDQAIGIGGCRSGSDLDKMLVIKETDGGITSIGKQIREQHRLALNQSPGRRQLVKEPRRHGFNPGGAKRTLRRIFGIRWRIGKRVGSGFALARSA